MCINDLDFLVRFIIHMSGNTLIRSTLGECSTVKRQVLRLRKFPMYIWRLLDQLLFVVVWCNALDETFQRKIFNKVQRIASLSITGVKKNFSQATLDTMACLTLFYLYVKQPAASCVICLRHTGILNAVFTERRNGWILILDRMLWNTWVLQTHKDILIFTDGSKVDGFFEKISVMNFTLG